MITRPEKVPERKITSVDLADFSGGQFMNGDASAPKTAIVSSKDAEIDSSGHIIPRRKLTKFLPDTVGISYQKFPALWDGKTYYFTADDGKIKYCLETDTVWTDCVGDNTITTNNGGMATFIRVLDSVMILNGKNGDRLAYVDMGLTGFPVVKYDLVTDPPTKPTVTRQNLSSGTFNVYYAFSYSGKAGETKLSPIETTTMNVVRDNWNTQTTPGTMTIARSGAVPADAQFWNVYISLAAPGGTIQDTDMLMLIPGIDLATTSFVDTGLYSINLSSIAPTANSTQGPRVDQGIVVEGNPIVFVDSDNPYAIWIGGGGDKALSFSTANRGYMAEPEKGTNYYPTNIIGFRTGQGTPALTVLFSNTEGLSKQAVLQQIVVNYGDTPFTVWGITEQHYGAAGVAAPNSAINYNGRLLFLSVDGIMSMESQASIVNVLSIKSVSVPIDPYIRSIKTSAMDRVVGTGWNNKYMWLIPSYGFNTPQEILVLDTNNKGTDGNGAWYSIKIEAGWIGVVSPPTSASFVYVSQGKRTSKLVELNTTFDLVDGVSIPFSTNATGAMVPISGEAHNSWMAAVQAMFYLTNVVGDIEVGVSYRNRSGRLKTKSKVYRGSVASPSHAGGWGDPQWTYAVFPQVLGWGCSTQIPESSANVIFEDIRIPVRINDITNEFQWFLKTPVGYNNFSLKSISLEGINLGIRPDL